MIVGLGAYHLSGSLQSNLKAFNIKVHIGKVSREVTLHHPVEQGIVRVIR